MITCQFEDGAKAALRHVVVDILLIKGNQILLVKRAPHLLNGGKYGVIGGYFERGETLIECARREAKEETGYNIHIEKLLTIVDSPHTPQEDRQNVKFVYLASPLTKTGTPDHESTEVTWFDLDKLPTKQEFAFDHYDMIQEYLQQNS